MHRATGALFHLCLIGTGLTAIVDAAAFSTPYTNTFDTADSTNDFTYNAISSPAGRTAGYVTWQWQSASGGTFHNYLNGSATSATLTAWATLEFSDLASDPALVHDFNMSATARAKSAVGGVTNKPGGFQGLCALGSDTNLASSYFGSIYFTNVVGSLQINKIAGGTNVLSATNALTIPFDQNKAYGMRLKGIHEFTQLILTLEVWDGALTNSVTLTDATPLIGEIFGCRDCNNSGSTFFWWDNFIVTSSRVPRTGTLLMID
jgi:hypothetical protein